MLKYQRRKAGAKGYERFEKDKLVAAPHHGGLARSLRAGRRGRLCRDPDRRVFGVELTPIGVHDAEEIERGIAAFARSSDNGLIMVGPPHRCNAIATCHACGPAPAAVYLAPYSRNRGLMTTVTRYK